MRRLLFIVLDELQEKASELISRATVAVVGRRHWRCRRGTTQRNRGLSGRTSCALNLINFLLQLECATKSLSSGPIATDTITASGLQERRSSKQAMATRPSPLNSILR